MQIHRLVISLSFFIFWIFLPTISKADPILVDTNSCQSDIDCKTDIPCNIDRCVFFEGQNTGLCIHTPGECAPPTNCDDNNACTLDSLVNGQCIHTLLNTLECNPPPPPHDTNSCHLDSDCQSNQPCVRDVCNIAEGQSTGLCEHIPQDCSNPPPVFPLPTPDCNDNDPCTSDSLVNEQCIHEHLNSPECNPTTPQTPTQAPSPKPAIVSTPSSPNTDNLEGSGACALNLHKPFKGQMIFWGFLPILIWWRVK